MQKGRQGWSTFRRPRKKEKMRTEWEKKGKVRGKPTTKCGGRRGKGKGKGRRTFGMRGEKLAEQLKRTKKKTTEERGGREY